MALTDIAIRNARAHGRPRKLADSGGLHLLVTPAGGKLWRVSTATFLAYALGGFLALVPQLHRFDLPNLPAPWWTLLIAVVLALASRGVYWLTLSQQRSYGDLFKSLFDQYRDKLGFAGDAAEIARSKGASQQAVLDSKYEVATRYLRWHRIRRPGQDVSMTPEAWAAKNAPPAGKP
jgi:hypothetical protein